MAFNFSDRSFYILFVIALFLEYSFAVSGSQASDKMSDVNDFAEFETEDDDDGYEDEIENLKPPEQNKANQFSHDEDDEEVDAEAGGFHLKLIKCSHVILY